MEGCGRDIEALKLMEECVIARTRILVPITPILYLREELLGWQTKVSRLVPWQIENSMVSQNRYMMA